MLEINCSPSQCYSSEARKPWRDVIMLDRGSSNTLDFDVYNTPLRWQTWEVKCQHHYCENFKIYKVTDARCEVHTVMLLNLMFSKLGFKQVILRGIFIILCIIFQISQYLGSPNIFFPTLHPKTQHSIKQDLNVDQHHCEYTRYSVTLLLWRLRFVI
jgi:hypothetical protein